MFSPQFRSKFNLVLLANLCVTCLVSPSAWSVPPSGYGKPKVERIPDGALSLKISIADPIKISTDAAKQLAAYQTYLKAIGPWEKKACKLSQEIYRRKPTNSDGVTTHRTYFSEFNIGNHSFSKEVLQEMPRRPTRVLMPAATKIPMTIKVTNQSKEPLPFNTAVFSDMCWIEYSIEGPGAHQQRYGPRVTTMEIRHGSPITLDPGASSEIKLQSTIYGNRGYGGHWTLTKPGTYKISATITCRPATIPTQIRLRSDPTPFKAILAN